MAALALVLWTLFGAVAVVLRVLLHLRRTGTTGVRGVSGAPGSAEWIGGVGFLGSIVLGVLAPVLDMAGAVEPIGSLDRTAEHVAGIALYGAGLIGVVWSQNALGSSWRIGVEESERTTLVTSGPFALARNPIYTAMIAVWLGLALLVPSVVALASVALLLLALELQTRVVEEPYLLRSHGDTYAAYAARVGRFLPRTGRLRRQRTTRRRK
jgi:protein-S-isoprenylcysteine O-methyltransferase Ste14